MKQSKKTTPFKKGHKLSVGNKSKRDVPQKKANDKFISSAIEEALHRKIYIEGKNPSTYMKRIAENLVATAAGMKGKPGDWTKAAKEIMDRLEGKPAQSIELRGNKDNPVQLITREMTDAEAARIYQSIIRRSNGDEE